MGCLAGYYLRGRALLGTYSIVIGNGYLSIKLSLMVVLKKKIDSNYKIKSISLRHGFDSRGGTIFYMFWGPTTLGIVEWWSVGTVFIYWECDRPFS